MAKATKKIQINTLPESPGVYVFRDKQNNVLYVGKAVNIKKRVSSYFAKGIILPKTNLLVSKIAAISTTSVTSELEALLLEAHLIKKFQPIFNSRAKDDKHPIYIKITKKDEFPRVFTARREDEPGSVYFGPFPSSSTVKQVLKFLRSIFPYDSQKTVGKSPCFWNQIGLCNPCPSEIIKMSGTKRKQSKATYRKNILNLINLLSRKTGKMGRNLTHEMERLAKEDRFEEAARIRDQLAHLDYITRDYRNVSSFLENPNLISDIRQEELGSLYKLLEGHKVLGLHPKGVKLNRIECFDASHTSLSSPTVGMVTFTRGEPEKNLYRRFRIKNNSAQDDLSFLEEALRRRFSHPEWGKPDLLVIDGGKTQVGRARQVLGELNLEIPVIGIVKPFDDVVIPHKDGFQIVRLRSGPAIRLLQRLRDEAHRFAKTYHTKLRSRQQFA